MGMGGLFSHIVADGVTYIKAPPYAEPLPNGKTWMRIDPSSMTPPPPGLAALVGGMSGRLPGGADPARAVGLLADAVEPVTTVGLETVGGVATTHYRFTVSAASTPSVPAAPQDSVRSPVDAWLDGLGRPVQIREGLTTSINLASLLPSAFPSPLASSIPVSLPTGPETVSMDFTVTFSAFEAAPPIVLPPAAEVENLSDYLKTHPAG